MLRVPGSEATMFRTCSICDRVRGNQAKVGKIEF